MDQMGETTVNAPGSSVCGFWLWITSEPAGKGSQPIGISQRIHGRSLVAFDTAPSITPSTEALSGFSTTYTVDDTVDGHDIVPVQQHSTKRSFSTAAPAAILGGCGASGDLPMCCSRSGQTQQRWALPEHNFGDRRVAGGYTDTGRNDCWGCVGRRRVPRWMVGCIRSAAYRTGMLGRTSKSGHHDHRRPVDRQSIVEIEAGSSSRRAGDDIYLITRHTPAIEGLIPYPATWK